MNAQWIKEKLAVIAKWREDVRVRIERTQANGAWPDHATNLESQFLELHESILTGLNGRMLDLHKDIVGDYGGEIRQVEARFKALEGQMGGLGPGNRLERLEERIGLEGEIIPECLEGRLKALKERLDSLTVYMSPPKGKEHPDE